MAADPRRPVRLLGRPEHQRLFDVGGAGVSGAPRSSASATWSRWWLHEAAHALAVKSYGRKVTRGGFMLMMGMPFAFVDTSDMWFGTRWSRMVVTLSGPLSTAGVAGALALWAPRTCPIRSSPASCFQLAFGLYLNTLYNFNPLMPLDGYQALSDALRHAAAARGGDGLRTRASGGTCARRGRA